MKRTILIADDHGIVRNAIKQMINGHFTVCGEAPNGAEAVEQTLELKPDLVILDFRMPIMNGLDAARTIRKVAPATKIIITSVHDSPVLERQFTEAGAADAFVPKSSLGRELPRIIEQLLGPE